MKTRRKVSCEGMPLVSVRKASPACCGHRAQCHPSSPRTRSPHTPRSPGCRSADARPCRNTADPRALKNAQPVSHRHCHSPFVDKGRTETPVRPSKSRQPISCVARGVGHLCWALPPHLLKHNPLDLVQAHAITQPVIERGRPGAFVCGHLLGFLMYPAIREIDGDPARVVTSSMNLDRTLSQETTVFETS